MRIVITIEGQPDPRSLEVPDTTSVAELVDAILPDAPLADLKVVVNRRPESVDRVLRPGDRVHLAWARPADSP